MLEGPPVDICSLSGRSHLIKQMTGFCSQHSSHSTEIASYGRNSGLEMRRVSHSRLEKGQLLWRIPAKLLACCSHRRCRQRRLLNLASIQPSSETVKADASLPPLHTRAGVLMSHVSPCRVWLSVPHIWHSPSLQRSREANGVPYFIRPVSCRGI
jgi:hypothetical protein